MREFFKIIKDWQRRGCTVKWEVWTPYGHGPQLCPVVKNAIGWTMCVPTWDVKENRMAFWA